MERSEAGASRALGREPTEMELRVARSIYKEATTTSFAPNGWDFDTNTRPQTRKRWLRIARAAIRAMREPTVTMMQAPRTKSVAHAVKCYGAMIDAASPPLNEAQ